MHYLSLRLGRHFLPETFARLLLRRGWIIRPGLETTNPRAATDHYLDVIHAQGETLTGKRVLLFGYGGSYAVAVELLRRGAEHVVLCDHIAAPDTRRNSDLVQANGKYLSRSRHGVLPRPEYITLLHGDVRTAAAIRVDFVLSTSVFEHVRDVTGVTRALSALTMPTGLHVHFVDLRDHVFKYPFEMLCFSQPVWMNFLNPTSNLNRFRVRDYQTALAPFFEQVDIQVLAREPKVFESVRRRIRPEFLTGDISLDSATLIQIVACRPTRQASNAGD